MPPNHPPTPQKNPPTTPKCQNENRWPSAPSDVPVAPKSSRGESLFARRGSLLSRGLIWRSARSSPSSAARRVTPRPPRNSILPPLPPTRQRMRRRHQPGQPLDIDMGIDLRRRDVGMSQHLLYAAQIRPMGQQMRRERMAQHVRREL